MADISNTLRAGTLLQGGKYRIVRFISNDGSYYIGTFKDNLIDSGKMYDAGGRLEGIIIHGEYVE